jgi:hypothetical protein
VAATTSIVLIIREDPRTSALSGRGTCASHWDWLPERTRLRSILMGQAVQLLAEETDDIVDIEILEKYLPSFEHLQIPFLLVFPSGPAPELQEGFAVTVGSSESARQAMAAADRVLVF